MSSPSGATTRRAASQDVGSLVELMREFHAESGFPLDLEHAWNAFLQLLARPELGCAWLASRDGAAAGYAVLTLRYTMEHGALCGHVDDLFVRAVFRGQRIGSGLMSEFVRECRSRGCAALHVDVGPANAAAISLYRRFGLGEFHDDRLFLRGGLAAGPC